mmetsp:Transcript_7914/g.22031  ORF Transcript_7914/g.22031 Transcript_7914/m.22031 type:complete len:308 (-) Transcript_7914:438-1361(-)
MMAARLRMGTGPSGLPSPVVVALLVRVPLLFWGWSFRSRRVLMSWICLLSVRRMLDSSSPVQNMADRSSSENSALDGTVANMTMGWKSTWNSCCFCFCCCLCFCLCSGASAFELSAAEVDAAVALVVLVFVGAVASAGADVDADALLRLRSAGIGGRGGGGRRLCAWLNGWGGCRVSDTGPCCCCWLCCCCCWCCWFCRLRAERAASLAVSGVVASAWLWSAALRVRGVRFGTRPGATRTAAAATFVWWAVCSIFVDAPASASASAEDGDGGKATKDGNHRCYRPTRRGGRVGPSGSECWRRWFSVP